MRQLVSRSVIIVALSTLGACATTPLVQPMSPADAQAVRADMQALNLKGEDADKFVGPIAALFRWESTEVPVAIVFADGFDRACRTRTQSHFNTVAAQIQRQTNLRFTRVDDPARARVLFEFAREARADQAFRALSKGENIIQTWKNPPVAGARRWEAWQLSDRARNTIERAWILDTGHYLDNSPGSRLRQCRPFDFAIYLKQFSSKVEIAPLNFGIERFQEPAQINRYDTMLLRVYYAEGARPGMTGAELAGRIKLAVQ
ncbi:MAG: hypothetical protein KF889_20745 [Alphaproteobacteria bacterium]|nr:hypothetical protein [Alphaproteobacteria bacterium]MCW5744377.1 hypothetical protein [Alphaproteobacteria bacterium]